MTTTRRVAPVLTVPADRLAETREAYERVLGHGVVMDLGWIVTLARPDGADQLSLMSQDRTAPVNPDVSVEVDDVEAAYRSAQDAGLEVVHPLQDEEWGVRRFFFRDAAGHVVNVLSHR